MMQNLLRTTIDDDMRNHGCEFPPERKLQLMEQLAQVRLGWSSTAAELICLQTKRPPNFGPSRRTHAKRFPNAPRFDKLTTACMLAVDRQQSPPHARGRQ